MQLESSLQISTVTLTHTLSLAHLPSLSGVTKSINTKELGNTKEKERLREWLELGESVPRVLSLCKDLPRVHAPRLFMLLTKRKADWLKALQEFKPQDILALQEHLPAHLAAAHPHPSGCEMLKLIIELDPKCLITRDSTGQCPLHIACANESDFAGQLVALVLEHAPVTAFAQDHHGMLPIHHACLNNGIAAGSISGRLISVFSPACQAVDDYNRLPLDCALSCSSPGVGEIIKSVVRAFPSLLDKHGDNVLHRASLHLETNPQIPDLIQALHEMKIRPNAGGLCNYSGQLPLHIASSSTSPLAARCIALLVDAYIPGAWAHEVKGDTPLHIPIRARNLESVQTLSFKSRDKAQHMQNYKGKFPLNLATSRPFRDQCW
jgi:ankyrin repeat protein